MASPRIALARFWLPRFGAGLATAALVLFGAGSPGFAQDYQLCVKLEARLMQLDRERNGGGSNVNQYRTAIAEAQRRLSVARQQAQRSGCGQQQGFLFFRPPRAPECQKVDAEIRQLETNLRNMQSRASQSAPSSSSAIDRERRNILTMLGENRCGPQYQRYARQRTAGLFGMFLRDYTRDPYMRDGLNGDRRDFYGTYRTLCVRSCDGFYWPVSFSTVQSHFAYDEQTCRRSCPGTDVSLYVHRNPGEGPEEAISLAGQPYAASPNAFRYRDEYVEGCSCKAGVQTADLGERVSVDLPARDGTLPSNDPWINVRPPRSLQLPPAAGEELGPADQSVDAVKTVALTPVPRPRPGNEIPVAGSIATLTGQEDFIAVDAPVKVKGAGGKSVRVVGPGFTLYRSAGEAPSGDRSAAE
jgi:hypothetical protein